MPNAHLIIFDLEATCDQGNSDFRKEDMETIEIGAVETDSQFHPTGREFQSFVKPFISTQLSDFCKNLTTITQEQVDAAPGFQEAFKEFLLWANFPHTRFISWGQFDYTQLTKDCRRLNMEMFSQKFHSNGKGLYREYMGSKGRGLGTEVEKWKIPFEGTAHRGIDDARMIARILRLAYEREK